MLNIYNYLTDQHNLVNLKVIITGRFFFFLMKCCKSSAWTPLLLSLKKSHYFYLEIILLIVQYYDTQSIVQPAVQPWIWKSVSESVHTWQCFLCCDASYIQWEMEFPGDSPFVLQETAYKFGWDMVSQERHAADLTYTIHRLSRIEWIRTASYIAPILSAHGNSLTLFFWPVFPHIQAVSLTETLTQLPVNLTANNAN